MVELKFEKNHGRFEHDDRNSPPEMGMINDFLNSAALSVVGRESELLH